MFQATPFSQNYTDPAQSSTTLGRWHRGYHGFEPNLTNKLGVSCNLSCSPSPAVRLSHRRSCDSALIRPLSPWMECMPTFVWNKIRPCFRRSQFRLCLENRRMSAAQNNSVWEELHQFPPLEPSLALLPIGSTGRTGPCAWMHLLHDFKLLAQRLLWLLIPNTVKKRNSLGHPEYSLLNLSLVSCVLFIITATSWQNLPLVDGGFSYFAALLDINSFNIS